MTTIIAGAKTREQVRENIGGAGWKLEEADIAALDEAFAAGW